MNINYYNVLLSGSNTDTITRFINLPFIPETCKVLNLNYIVDPSDPSSEKLYVVYSDLFDNNPLGTLFYNNSTIGNTFDINKRISGNYTFYITDLTGNNATLTGEFTILLQFEKDKEKF